MRILIRSFAVLILLAAIGILALIFWPIQRTPATALPADFQTSVDAGKYAMLTADCLACHTTKDGKPFAGGRVIDSPLGDIWATNITPDKETGIGSYTLEDFRAALYDGIRKDGKHLYPAMPYENYRHLTEADVQNMYAYFMEEVEPVHNKVQKTDLDFPFNQRWGLRAWNWLALSKEAGFTPPQGHDEQYIRGAYLVEAPGHCAACHSPRNGFMAQEGRTARDASFLSGGQLGGWISPDLRGSNSASAQWSVEEMIAFLTTARNAHTSAVGEMTLVVSDSLQYLTPEDSRAMAVYLKEISATPAPTPSSEVTETEKMLDSANPDMALGPRLYLDNCAGCHFTDGKGAPEVFPELTRNSLVTAENPTGLLHVILHGAELPSTEVRPAKLRMPDFGWRLDDEEAAALATFVRQGWHNEASSVSADEAAAVRNQNKE